MNPLTKAIQEYPITIQTYAMVQSSEEGVPRDDSIKVQSNEGQQINLDVVIQYQVEKAKASQLYLDWGGAPISRGGSRGGAAVHAFAGAGGGLQVHVGGAHVEQARGDGRSDIIAILTKEFDRRHLTLVSFGDHARGASAAAVAARTRPEDPGAAGGRAAEIPTRPGGT